jgi:putative methionine-R-sulfoxide reductase with GAF domain
MRQVRAVKVTLNDEQHTEEQDMLSAGSQSVESGLEKQRFLNWSLLVIAFLIIALGVLTVVPPLLSERLASFWPWPKPQMVLIVVLCLALLALTGLAHQRRYIGLLRRQFENAQREEVARVRKHTQRMFALLNVSRMLGSWSDLQKVFDSVTQMCVDAFDSQQTSLMIFDRDRQELVVRAVAGHAVPHTMMGAKLKLGEGIAGYAAKHGKALLIGPDFDFAVHSGLELKNASLTFAMVVPIILRDELVGVLNVSTRSRKTKYDEDDMKVLQVFAEGVGACIRHTEQASWMRQTIRNLQEAIKARRTQADAYDDGCVAPGRLGEDRV